MTQNLLSICRCLEFGGGELIVDGFVFWKLVWWQMVGMFVGFAVDLLLGNVSFISRTIFSIHHFNVAVWSFLCCYSICLMKEMRPIFCQLRYKSVAKLSCVTVAPQSDMSLWTHQTRANVDFNSATCHSGPHLVPRVIVDPTQCHVSPWIHTVTCQIGPQCHVTMGPTFLKRN